MGIFNRNKDEPENGVADDSYGQADDQQAAALPAPSVDGVLPPGVQPQPAPPSHNLASQTLPHDPASDDVSNDPVTDNDAGDYIVSDPPVQQIGYQSQPPADVPTEDADITPAYQELDAPEPPAPEPIPEPVFQQQPDTEPEPQQEPETLTQSPEESEPQAESDLQSEDETPADAPAEPVLAEETPAEPVAVNVTASSPSELDDIKRQALTQLSSLAGHLEQTPEERFHTTMMLVQATDDRSLIKTAYEAAQAITDEKARAQALLDVVNEINYFSAKNS